VGPLAEMNDTKQEDWSVVLDGCETWSIALREKHKGKGLKKGTIFGSKKDEVSGMIYAIIDFLDIIHRPVFYDIHDEEMHDLQAS
jgi:hypothetical protein